MLLSSNELNCWFIIIICCFSSEISANVQIYPRKDIDGFCSIGLLKDATSSRFSASSVYQNQTEFGPDSSRIEGLHDSFTTPKAWCPYNPVYNVSSEWLQIEFSSLKIITSIFTQGRSDGNYGEFVTNYYFDYQRESGLTWFRYNDTSQGQLIPGNNDYRNSAYKRFESYLVVKRIRIIPISLKSPTKVCLRIGLYGCDYNDEVIEYQMPRGDVMVHDSKYISFDDDNYDGKKFSNQTWLQGGLGRLMDNIGFKSDKPINTIQNYIVAWKQKSNSHDHIDILFKFYRVRQLQSLSIYYNEDNSYNFYTFKSIAVEFLDETDKGSFHISNKIEIPNPIFISDEPFIVDLKKYQSKFVRIKLFFRNEWIALNEIVFITEDIPKNIPIDNNFRNKENINDVLLHITSSTVKTPAVYVSQNVIYYIILIICVIGSIILLGVVFFLCFLWMKQRQRRRYKNKFFDHRSMIFNDPYSNTCGLRTISGNNPLLYRPLTPHSYVPPITNNAQNMGFRFVHSQFPPCPDYFPPSLNNEYEAIDSYWPKTLSQSISFTDNKLDHLDRQNLITTPAPDITCTNKNGAVYCSASSYSSNIYSQPDNEINFPAPDLLPIAALTNESLNGIYKIHFNNPLKGPLGSTISNFQLTPASQSWIESALSRIPEIHASQINLEALVTEGEIAAFVSGHMSPSNTEIIVARYKSNSHRKDSKSLFYRQCFAKLKEDFSSHPNLLSIIGHCLLGLVGDNNTPSIIYAYPSQINIVKFFTKLHLIPRTNDISFACSYVSQSSLLYVVKQLAGALSYLSELGVVHKDVSARNCSIGEHFHLILSDFAVGMEEFNDDYIPLSNSQFNADPNSQSLTVQLPLLWMPWEAIIMGNYSTKSDIWSFGVTMWEIFTECQMKPYSALYNQTQDLSVIIPNIIRNSMLIANNHPSSILPNNRSLDVTQVVHDNPANPLDSSKQIRDIMTDCWRSDPAVRPNFQKLYSLLCNLIPTSKPLDEYGALYQMIS